MAILTWLLAFPSPSARGQDDSARGQDAGKTPADPVLVTRILWSGHLDGLDSALGDDSFLLLPDGRGFLYYQGAPWPRLLYRSIDDPRAEPLMVAPIVPLASLPARMSPAGDAVYFTVVDDVETLPQRGDASRTLEVHVVRVTLPDRRVRRIHPPRSQPDAFTLLLDIHPSGETLLVGTGRGFTGRSSRRADVRFELQEIPATGGPPAALGIRPGGLSLVRYSRDGNRIEFTEEAAADPGAEVKVYHRGTGRLEFTGRPPSHLPRHAGELDVRSYLLPHRGSFGRDGFLTHEIGQPGAARAASLYISREIHALSPLGPLPLGFQAGRILLRTGNPDHPRLVVAEYERRAPATPGTRAPGARPPGRSPGNVAGALRSILRLDPGFAAGRILASHDPGAAGILEALRAHLRGAGTRVPAALKTKLLQSPLGAEGGGVSAVEVVEDAGGRIRIEHILELGSAGEEKDNTRPEAAGPRRQERAPTTVRQVFGFDGERTWMQSENGAVSYADRISFCRQLNVFSLFRLLLDPAGLADSHLRIGKPASRPTGDGRMLVELPLSYEDGYRATLVLQATDGGFLPVSVRSPLHLPSRRLEAKFGRLPREKELSFHDWTVHDGWRLPREVRFENGYSSYRLRVERLEFLDRVDAKLFRPPGG